MIPPKQVKAAADTFTDEVGGALRDVMSRLPDPPSGGGERDAAEDAFAIAAGLIDIGNDPTDDQLWGLIFAFGRHLPGELMRAMPADLRRGGLLDGRARWFDRISPLFEILINADRRFGTRHSRTYYDRALHLAFTVAALEARPSREELGAIDVFRDLMLDAMDGLPDSPLAGTRSGSAPRDSPVADEPERHPAPDDRPSRPIEELLGELDALIGLEGVKAEVRIVTNLLRVQQLRAERGLPTTPRSRHLIFTGNPGTGKTTVARLLADIYRSLGIVETGQLVETDRAGLVSGYIGQTAAKTMEVVERAIGGVLLVDEAYALARGGPNDFGREAIDTLVKVIEDQRDDLVVIVAGYPDEMADFIGANPGLASRFPKTIFFPDYGDEELRQIFALHARRASYIVDPDAEKAARRWFASIPRDKGFGNGRLARNLFEDSVARQAGRIVEMADPSDEEIQTLTAQDVAPVGAGPLHRDSGA